MGSGEDLLVEDFRFFVLALFQVTRGQIVFGFRHVWVVRAEFAFVDFEGSLVVPFDFFVFTLKEI